MMRIEELARRIGLSQSALERRFRRLVGTSRRKFASLVRLQHVVRLRQAGADFTSIAHAAALRYGAGVEMRAWEPPPAPPPTAQR